MKRSELSGPALGASRTFGLDLAAEVRQLQILRRYEQGCQDVFHTLTVAKTICSLGPASIKHTEAIYGHIGPSNHMEL